MSWAEQARARLRERGRRTGAARNAVIDVLSDSDGGLSAAEVAQRARSPRGPVSKASAYRILSDLVALDLVRGVDLGAGQTRWELVHADGHHSHHLVCDDCGRTDRFLDAELERAIHAAEARLGFDSHAHDIVLHGRCGECRSPSGRSAATRSSARAASASH